MNDYDVDNFISILTNNREKIVDKLLENYSYDYLLSLFQKINGMKNLPFLTNVDDKIVYKLLTATYTNSRYQCSSIDYIPSSELVVAIVSLLKHFHLSSIEEVYAGLGILAALISRQDSSLQVTASDTFQHQGTCNQLNIFSIAKRSPADFKYYKALNKQLPQVIVSSYFHDIVSGADNILFTKYLKQVVNLVKSKNHSIIILIQQNTTTDIYEKLYYLGLDPDYSIYYFHLKIIDKHFLLSRVFNKQYPSLSIGYFIIKKSLLTPDFNRDSLENIISEAIFKTEMIDPYCYVLKNLKLWYTYCSTKLIMRIYRCIDFTEPLYYNKEVTNALKILSEARQVGIKISPHIYEIQELFFWFNHIKKNIYLWFPDRDKFFDFFTTINKMENASHQQDSGQGSLLPSDSQGTSQGPPTTATDITLPYWINRSQWDHSKYVYLNMFSQSQTWKNDRHHFFQLWNMVNEENKAKIIESSH